MKNRTLKEIYAEASSEIRVNLSKMFSKEELGIETVVNQEEFNRFFREILKKYKKNIRVINSDFSNYEKFDENGEWLFEVDYNPKYQWFFYTNDRIFPLFKEKLVIAAKAEKEANELKQQALTPSILRQMEIEKWDGKLPQYMLGNNIPFILK